MALQKLAALIIRLAGLYFLLTSISGGIFLFRYQGVAQSNYYWLVVLPFVLYQILAIACILMPMSFVNLLMPASYSKLEGGKNDILGTPELETLTVVLASIAGFYFFLTSLSDLVYYVTHWLVSRQYGIPYGTVYWTAEQLGGMVATLIEFMAGLYFMFGARGLLNLVQKVRDIHPQIGK